MSNQISIKKIKIKDEVWEELSVSAKRVGVGRMRFAALILEAKFKDVDAIVLRQLEDAINSVGEGYCDE